MKKNVKSTISFFRLLIEHSQKDYEPSPGHILKRMLMPLCEHFAEIAGRGPGTTPGTLSRVSCRNVKEAKDAQPGIKR